MLNKTLVPFGIALILGGCVIRTYGHDPEPPRAHARPKPAQPTAAKAQPPAAKKAPEKTAEPARDKATPKVVPPNVGEVVKHLPTASDLAPRISAPNVFGSGKDAAFRGVAYVIPENSTQMPDLRPLVPFATLFTDKFEIKSQEFSQGFPGVLMQEEWFAIRYDGAFSVPRDGGYKFRLSADDGAILYIDGQKSIDNDGVHSEKSAAADLHLKAGSHRLRLDYFQAKKGSVALSLFIADTAGEKPLIGTK